VSLSGSGKHCSAIGTEQLVGDAHAVRAAERDGLRLVDPTDPRGDNLAVDELVQNPDEPVVSPVVVAGDAEPDRAVLYPFRSENRS
jgi:hypothetical protein